jgi:hypothetical protein
MTEMEVAEMTRIIADLEARLAAEREKAAYWQQLAETFRLRAQSLAEELEAVK